MSETAHGSHASTEDSTGTEDGFAFKNFMNFPSEIRSMIWKAAAEAAKPCGVYHFTYKKMKLGEGPRYPDLSDTVLTHLHKIPPSHQLSHDIHELLLWSFKGESVLTFTPSSTTAGLTRQVRDLLRSCAEARTEIMRSPTLSSSFDFHYMKGGKCNLGTVRPFYYDTDWVSMDGLDHDRAGALGYLGMPNILCTPDICRIQHFAFPYAYDAPWDFNRAQLDIVHLLSGLKSIGFYHASFCIKRAPHWDNLIEPEMKLFLKGIPASMSGPVSGPQLNARKYKAAISRLICLVRMFVFLADRKITKGWHANNCDLTALNACLLIHADSQEGLNLMKFEEDGSHLDNIVQLENLGPVGPTLKMLRGVGSI
jgi:hypothetical protein